MENEGSGIQMERQLRHDADDQHESGEKDAGGAIVAKLEELGDGVDASSNVVGEEQRASDKLSGMAASAKMLEQLLAKERVRYDELVFSL